MNILMIIYSYYFYKIYKFYKYAIKLVGSGNEQADHFATLAYGCFLLYTIAFIEIYFSKCYFYDIISRENMRISVIIEGAVLFLINYLIFNYKDQYLKIEEYFDKKGNRTTSIIGYLSFLVLVIVLIWFGAKVFMMGRPGADWQIPK